MPYQSRTVLCGAPAELEPERQAVYAAIGACNEAEAMPRGILYVPLSLPASASNKAAIQDAMDYNIRLCDYYVLLLADSWGSPLKNFAPDYRLALECRDDPMRPLKEVVVFLKTLPAGQPMEPAVAEFRQRLAAGDGPRHFCFTGVEEFQTRFRSLLSEWLPPAFGTSQVVSAPAARPMTSEDDLFVHDLIVHLVSDELGAATWPEALRRQLLEIQYQARIRGIAENFPAAAQEILLHDGLRAGWAVVDRNGAEIRLVDIAVTPASRGKGIATARIGALLAESDRVGKPVRLSVVTTNPALALYQRLGFHPTGGDGMRLFLERPPARSLSGSTDSRRG